MWKVICRVCQWESRACHIRDAAHPFGCLHRTEHAGHPTIVQEAERSRGAVEG